MNPSEQVRAFIRDAFFVDQLGDEQSFLGTGVLDSMGMMQLVAFLEQAFGIAVADEDLVPENLDSVARVAGFVDRKLRRPAA